MDPLARGYEDFAGHVAEFASESRPAWPARATPRAGAPNVVVMLIDDLGFSDLGPFGSEIDTPHIDALAERGWVFTNYHTAPMCSPARASLLTGLNPHRAGFGYVAHTDPGYPGFACELPDAAPTLAESLRAGGYATFMVGKWHLTLESRLHDGADKSSWPLQRGFDRYYGSMDGFTSLHHPHRLISDNSPVDVPEFPEGYFLTDDLNDRAIGMIDDLRANDESKPFFLYYAHTSVHGPIQAKQLDIEKYRGRYEAGWTRIREERFARQRAAGIVPAHAALPSDGLPESDAIPSWDTLADAERQLFARHMEVYAAAVDEIDQSVGRLVARLTELGELDNTIFVVTSDNGGTAEGGPTGTRSYFSQFGMDGPLPPGWVSDVPRDPELIGGPRLFSQYPTGWARVSNTPWRAFKSSTYEGGVHAPLVLSWPDAPRHHGERLRHQFVFVSDLAPTILELAGVEPLASRGPVAAPEVDGRSFAGVLDDPRASARDVQYVECVGRRALFADGVKAVSPIPPTKEDGASGGVWELYDLTADPTETHDLSRERPELVQALAERWRREAWRNTVFPLDDDGSLHTVRPATEASLSEPVTLAPYRPPLERYRAARLTVLRSFTVEIDARLDPGAAGVLVAHGDQGGGYSLSVEDGRLHLAYNAYGDMHRASAAVDPGRRRLILRVEERAELRWSLSVEADGVPIARIDTVPMLLGMAPFTGISIGYDYGSPVDWEQHARHGAFRFRGGELAPVRYVPGERSPFDPVVLREIHDAVALVAD